MGASGDVGTLQLRSVRGDELDIAAMQVHLTTGGSPNKRAGQVGGRDGDGVDGVMGVID